ncbi:hypothetical protein CLPU_11c00080 [Gottschalkia purinilytica]|uniref:Uncharacterized protein n=1 Tax=Gottschalkia purinilytica TaxID=1503 RepID=A0A0L0W944_GOTPU|nr:hypothetical protein [Gottschalkia purinilytica]KNF07840.1 hypothetical protein CLPU_11c00080 [Gottschalkia purinilytica]
MIYRIVSKLESARKVIVCFTCNTRKSLLSNGDINLTINIYSCYGKQKK